MLKYKNPKYSQAIYRK